MPNPNSWTTKLTLLLASSLTVMSGATVSPSLPAMKQQFESAIPFQGGFANADPDLRTTLVKLVSDVFGTVFIADRHSAINQI